jgi:hypothetical protein
MTPAELLVRSVKAIKARSDETALFNGRNHTRSLDEHRYYAGVCDGVLAAIEILNETMKHADDEDE